MRISDWSSDVCSSDLVAHGRSPSCHRLWRSKTAGARIVHGWCGKSPRRGAFGASGTDRGQPHIALSKEAQIKTLERRSEERRVGQEDVSRCRSRWPTTL